MVRAGTCALAVFFTLTACTPMVMPPGPTVTEPTLTDDGVLYADDTFLSVRTWAPMDGKVKAIIIALHGFNDYNNFFDEPGKYFAGRGIMAYAFDQRGFGRAAGRGYWPGAKALVDDLKTATALVRRRHGGMPLYLLGESMGGAVVMTAMTGKNPPQVDGVILSAPAVWGRDTMPFYQRASLDISAHILPWFRVTGQGLGIKASDNIEMLRALGRDPLVIKETRIDAVYGLVNLMDAAQAAAPVFDAPALFLFGRNDEVIPDKPTLTMISALPREGRNRRTIAFYEHGYHMLLRDLQAKTVWRDIAAWIAAPTAPLPSGADERVLKSIAKE